TAGGATSISGRGSQGASGAVVTMNSNTANITVSGTVDLSASDGLLSGNGGYLGMRAAHGTIALGGTVDVSGQGENASGGLIQIAAMGDLTAGTGKLVARGLYDNLGFSASGGDVAIVSTYGAVSLTGVQETVSSGTVRTAVDVSSAGGSAGTVLIAANGLN